MKELLPHLIESLREELKEYGEMLALLDRHELLTVPQPSPDFGHYVTRLQTQFETVTVARHEREQRQRQVLRRLGLPEVTTFAELLPYLPADYRPLLQALAQENQESLSRVRQHARQHQLLLHRVAELLQCFVSQGLRDPSPPHRPELCNADALLPQPPHLRPPAPWPHSATKPVRPEA